MITNLHLSKGKGDPITNEKQYINTVGALKYVTITRPEIGYSVNKVSQFMQNPLDEHWKALKRILRYLKGTINHGLTLKACTILSLSGFAVADCATYPDDRRSTSRCVYT